MVAPASYLFCLLPLLVLSWVGTFALLSTFHPPVSTLRLLFQCLGLSSFLSYYFPLLCHKYFHHMCMPCAFSWAGQLSAETACSSASSLMSWALGLYQPWALLLSVQEWLSSHLPLDLSFIMEMCGYLWNDFVQTQNFPSPCRNFTKTKF